MATAIFSSLSNNVLSF